jgi:CheY-like chemotaxis protein
MGYQSIEAGEGAEALRLYGENHAEIQGILMDVMMPVMDGYETATGIRAMEEKQALRRMPIIAVTSLTDQELKKHASSEAFDCHVDKPTSMSKLATIFESMRMAPSLITAELQAVGAANAAKLDPHGTKRSHLPVSSGDTTSDDGKHGGSNDGSSEQNGRKGSNSDADPDARSSGDSGNEQRYVSKRADGPCNSSKRPDANASSKVGVAPKMARAMPRGRVPLTTKRARWTRRLSQTRMWKNIRHRYETRRLRRKRTIQRETTK